MVNNRECLPTNDEDESLVERYRAADQDARDELIVARMGLVAHIARQYQGRGLPLEDLEQEGVLGLIRAIDLMRFEVRFPEGYTLSKKLKHQPPDEHHTGD